MNSCMPPHALFIQPVKTNAFFYGSCLVCSIRGCREEPFPSVAVWLTRIVSHQILMSVRCPPHAPREHVPTRRVPSRVSYVSLVLRCLRMDSSVKVRLSAVFVQKCAFVVPNRCVFVCSSPEPTFAHKGECAAVNGIKCKRYDLESPPYLSPESQNTSSRHHIIVGLWTPPPLAPFIPSLHNTMRHQSQKKNDVSLQISSKDGSVDILWLSIELITPGRLSSVDARDGHLYSDVSMLCVQMWMSAWWLTCARASCVWTAQDPTPAGAVGPASNCPRMVTAVRVNWQLCGSHAQLPRTV